VRDREEILISVLAWKVSFDVADQPVDQEVSARPREPYSGKTPGDQHRDGNVYERGDHHAVHVPRRSRHRYDELVHSGPDDRGATNTGMGMCMSGATTTLYMSHDDPATGMMSLYTRDLTTGAEMLIGAYPNSMFIHGDCLFVPVPEQTWALGGVGLAGVDPKPGKTGPACPCRRAPLGMMLGRGRLIGRGRSRTRRRVPCVGAD
jgi:hypothetical protein